MCVILPGMKRLRLWKDSREVDPRAQRCTGSVSPPIVTLPVWVYSCTPGGSWMQGRWRLWVSQMMSILSWSTKGMPMVSLASLKASSICPISCSVSSTPRVQRRQCCASCLEVSLPVSCSSVRPLMPCCCSSSLLFASLSRATSPSSQTKMQAESFAMNRP